ncbi:MAG: RNA methyltransferase [Planctomycetota bacterium]
MPISRSRLKDLRELKRAAGRRAQLHYLVEGVRTLEESLRFDQLPSAVLYAPARLNDRARSLLDDLEGRGVRVEALPEKQLDSIADTKTPQGAIAEFPLPDRKLNADHLATEKRILVCDGVSDPGNLGTLIRSALAFGFQRVITVGDSADPHGPKVVRSSVGAVFGLPLTTTEREELQPVLKDLEFQTIATVKDGDAQRLSLAKEQRVALVLGSEAHGVHPDWIEASTLRLRIEHTDAVESLNVAIAGSIVMRDIREAGRE